MIVRKFPWLLAALVCCLTAPASAQPKSPSSTQVVPSITIHVTTAPDDTVTPLLYAMQSGMFARAGITIDLNRTNSGSAAAAAVASGAMDIGRGSLLPLISAHARGIKFVIVAPSTMHDTADPDSGILVLANSPLRSAKDLAGKVVSVAGLYDLNWLATKAWLDQNGGDSTSIQFVEIPNSAVLAGLENGRIVAGTLTQPFMSIDLQSGKVRYFGDIVDAISLHMMEVGWYTSGDFAAKHPDVVKRFRSVMIAATTYTNAHPSATIDLLAKFLGMDVTSIAHIKRAVTGTVLDPRLIQPMIDAAARYNVIPKSFPAEELL